MVVKHLNCDHITARFCDGCNFQWSVMILFYSHFKFKWSPNEQFSTVLVSDLGQNHLRIETRNQIVLELLKCTLLLRWNGPNHPITIFTISFSYFSGGLCNLCLDKINKDYILEAGGVSAVVSCLASANEETVLSAVTTLMYLSTPQSRQAITTLPVIECMLRFSLSNNQRLKNLATIFLEDYCSPLQVEQARNLTRHTAVGIPLPKDECSPGGSQQDPPWIRSRILSWHTSQRKSERIHVRYSALKMTVNSLESFPWEAYSGLSEWMGSFRTLMCFSIHFQII